MRGRGGYIGFNRLTSTSAASGVWTIKEAEEQQRAGAWPLLLQAPQLVSGLQLWLDAADAGTLYDATSGGSLVATDGGVARWEDKSGNGRHATQSTGLNRPLRKAAVQNSRDVLRFDGSNDSLSLASNLALGTAHSMFVVFRPSSTITTISSGIVVSGGSYVSNTTSEFFLGLGSQTGLLTNERLSLLAVADNGSGVAGVYGSAKTDADLSGIQMVYYSFTTSGNAFVGRLNAAGSFATNSSPGGFSSTNFRYPTMLRRFGSGDGSGFLDGDICEVIVYGSVISDSNRTSVENYLSAKWGIT
jgi:hypothetical protein